MYLANRALTCFNALKHDGCLVGWRFIPKHSSWLDIDEIELSMFIKQCLNWRILDLETLQRLLH